MTERHQELSRWLEAEEAGADWDAADASFSTVASRWLPLEEAPAGLTGRIMAAMPRAAETPWSRALAGLLASWWARGAVGAAMLVLGVGVAAVILGQFITFSAALYALSAGGSAALAAVSTMWHTCAAAWPIAVSLGQAAGELAATRTAALVVFVNLALAAGAFAGLNRLLAVREEEV